MCKAGNGSIYNYCRAELLGMGLRTNKEQRDAVEAQGGCFNPETVEVITSIREVAEDVAAIIALKELSNGD